MPPRVHLEKPVVHVSAGAELPQGVSAPWLVGELSAEIRRQAGDVHLTAAEGGAAPAVIYAPGRSPAEQAPSEEFSLALDCDVRFCLLDLRRRRDGLEYQAQSLLPRRAGLTRWRNDLRRAARSLYRQPGLRLDRAQLASGSDRAR